MPLKSPAHGPFCLHQDKRNGHIKKGRVGAFLDGGGRDGSGSGAALPGLAARQHEIAVIEQGRQRVADCGPVLISKGVGAQIDIGPSEGLL